MTGSAPQLAHQPEPGALPEGRSPLAHLLHALNQPLTGLQCSLELAAAGPRRAEQYLRTLREGLDLTARMRVLVEAIRELADAQPPEPWEMESFSLDLLLREIADGLVPVAESKLVRVQLASVALPVRAPRGRLPALLFRLLESALALACEGSELRISAITEQEKACLALSWQAGPLPAHSPFSRPELGLLIAQAGWEEAGGEWFQTRSESAATCRLLLPLASQASHPSPASNLASPEMPR